MHKYMYIALSIVLKLIYQDSHQNYMYKLYSKNIILMPQSNLEFPLIMILDEKVTFFNAMLTTDGFVNLKIHKVGCQSCKRCTSITRTTRGNIECENTIVILLIKIFIVGLLRE